MTPELFSCILVGILLIAVAGNVIVNKRKGAIRDRPQSVTMEARRQINEYVGSDPDSRFIRELDLAPLKILSDELSSSKKQRRKHKK